MLLFLPSICSMWLIHISALEVIACFCVTAINKITILSMITTYIIKIILGIEKSDIEAWKYDFISIRVVTFKLELYILFVCQIHGTYIRW